MIGKILQKIKILDIRRQCFQRLLKSPDGKQFMAYMKRRLMPSDTPFHKDPIEMGRRVGHQEAFMIMCQLANMSDEQIQQLKEQNNV